MQLPGRALERLRACDSGWYLVTGLQFHGYAKAFCCGDSGAEMIFEEGMSRARELGDLFYANDILLDLTQIASRKGENDRAATLLAESIQTSVRIDSPIAFGAANSQLCEIELLNGNISGAERYGKAALRFFHRIGALNLRARAISFLAEVALHQNHLIRAAVLIGTALLYLPHYDVKHGRIHRNLLPIVRDRLSPNELNKFMCVGEELSLLEVVKYALSDSFSLPQNGRRLKISTDLKANRRQHLSLTRRETEVLARLAGGRTNQEIAADLFVSEYTVANHLQKIYRKIGCSNRTEASKYAIDHELVI